MSRNSRFASGNVAAFLRTATAGQKAWYMAQGEPQCLTGCILDDKGLKTVLYPGLRDIVVGQATSTEKEAVAKASEVLDELKADAGIFEPFDEAAYGVDDEAIDLAAAFDEASVRLERIAHIGTMREGSPSDVLKELVEDMDVDHPVSAMHDLPHVVRIKLSDEDMDDEALMDDFLMGCHDAGAMGFLVEASVPEMRPNGPSSFSVHYGSRRTDVFYASTFAQACRKALEWAAEEVESMRTGERRMRPSLRPAPAPVEVDEDQPTML
jgi:hypothetical protein